MTAEQILDILKDCDEAELTTAICTMLRDDWIMKQASLAAIIVEAGTALRGLGEGA